MLQVRGTVHVYPVQTKAIPRMLMPAWIINDTYNKVWGEITYPFPNFNGATVEV